MAKKIITSRKGRKCKSHGCKHILSVYNHEDYCNVHSQNNQKTLVTKAK